MAIADHSTAILDALDDGLTLWDRDDRLVLCTARYRQILGLAPPALPIGIDWTAAQATLDTAGIFAAAFSAATPDHELADGRWIRMIERPAAEGGTMRLVRDITADKARERDQAATIAMLLRAKQAAEETSHAKSSFLAGMSHELRTPLNAVLGFAEIIRDQVFGRHDIDRYSGYAGDIHASGLHLLNLIDDILDLSKIEAGKMELREDIVDLESLVASAFSLVQQAAFRSGVTLRRLARERIALRIDAMKLKQCLLNLLSNAIKFTPSGGAITFSVHLDAEHLSLRVQDTGIGIAPADIARVFEPFRQIDGSMSRMSHGTGLGMPLTKLLIELHGGAIALDSEVGRGTLVELLLPVERVVAQEGWDEDLTELEVRR
jgi:two-component system, cell cycle sensor histidine kinase PleC